MPRVYTRTHCLYKISRKLGHGQASLASQVSDKLSQCGQRRLIFKLDTSSYFQFSFSIFFSFHHCSLSSACTCSVFCCHCSAVVRACAPLSLVSFVVRTQQQTFLLACSRRLPVLTPSTCFLLSFQLHFVLVLRMER